MWNQIFFKFRNQISLGLITLAFCFSIHAQCISSADLWKRLSEDGLSDKTPAEKLQSAMTLFKQFENCKLKKDSVYSRLLDRIGLYEYNARQDINAAIKYSIEAARASSLNQQESSSFVTATAYKNLGYYYRMIMRNNEALNYFDTAIMYAKKRPDGFNIVLESRKMRCSLFFKHGDYQKCTDESSLALIDCKKYSILDFLAFFYNQRAQSYNYQSRLNMAQPDADSAFKIAERSGDLFEMATALKTKAIICEKQQKKIDADGFFRQAIKYRIQTGELGNVADDYTDYGNFLIDSCSQFLEGIECYLNTVKYAKKIGASDQLSIAYANIGQASFRQGNYEKAMLNYIMAMQTLNINSSGNLFEKVQADKFNQVSNKDVLIALLGNKTELLLQLYRQTKNIKILDVAIETAKVTDSVITQIRHEQTGDQSKLYWRNKTREFYTNAMEACWLAKDNALAFYFMEKSRAVLLNDKLNELGAQSHLSAGNAAKEEALQINIITEQQRLNALTNDAAAYSMQQQKILEAKAEQEHFIKSLEQKYPVYYQYKYADDVPSLSTLQKFIGRNKQQFVQYFINDTVIYYLVIAPNECKFHKLTGNDFSINQLKSFINFCADRNLLNARFSEFASISNYIFSKLFQPGSIAKGRVIICPDTYLVPFEALSSTADGRHFLLEDYAFSYVYSAGFLLKKYEAGPQEGNFLGMAPGIFAANLKVPALKNSTTAINTSADYFSGVNLFTGTNASRKNFMTYLPRYAVVNIFSHAYADSTDDEPLLYMQDSAIKLSELDLINNPAAQLIILSACQTNVGKNAMGEGVYSMARGFASVGVPAVAATLWKADEESIYAITAFFNQNLAKGLNKDDALRKAKLDFIKENDNDKLLPFYWANMVLVGSTEPVNISKNNSERHVIAIVVFLVTLISFILFKRRKSAKSI